MPPAHSGDREPLPSAPATDVKALVAAADLALATGRTRDGLNSLQEAVIAIVKGVGDRRAAALPGAIIGNVRTTLGDRIEMEPPLSLLWSFELDPGLTPAGLRLNTDLLFASIASNSKRLDRFDQLGLPRFRTNESIVQALVVFDDIGSFEGGRSVEARYRSAQGALGANAVQWAQDLQLNKDDTYHWEHARVRGALVDMRRLAFEIALIRRREGEQFRQWRSNWPTVGFVDELDRFVTELAGEIERERP